MKEEILHLYYYTSATTAEIAKKLAVPYECVLQAIAEAEGEED